MSDLKTTLSDVIQQISEVTDLFYQQKKQDAYLKLNTLLSTVSGALDQMYQWDLEHHVLEEIQQKVMQILGEAMQAIESKDFVLLADILQYDLNEQFEQALDKIN